MIWSKDRCNSFGRGAARMVLGASLFALGITSASVLAMAQTSAAPKGAAGAAPAAPAQPSWVKLCVKNEQTQNKEICLIQHETFDPNMGIVMVYAAIRTVEGDPKKQFIVRMPTVYSLVMPTGAQVVVDKQQPTPMPFSVCFPASCQADMELTDDILGKMRAGQQMVVAAMNVQKKTMAFPVPLTGFSKAFDGPPTDTAAYEQQRRQTIEMYRKRQQELAAKARQGQQPGQPQQGVPQQPAPAPGQ
ncbi:MAG: invasion associated locus B family protein [Pseudomonadota bacterium]